MPMNRVQFQPGLSMPEFLGRYGTEQQCEAALEASRWPSGWRCPQCAATGYSRFVRDSRSYWQCTLCRHQCTVTSGTIFEATKLPLSRWFLAMHLLTQSKNNVSALELKRHLGVCYKTAWSMKHKLMEVMLRREAGRRLEGRVEVDDAYLGGERTGGKRGRGSENKVGFIAAVQTTEAGQPLYACLRRSPFTQEALTAWARQCLAGTSTVFSDGLACFRAVVDVGAKHHVTVTGGGKAAAKAEQFWAVNTLLSNLKTSLSGTYHAIGFEKYAQRYLSELQYRFNRRFDMKTILVRLVRAAATTPPLPGRMLRVAEDGH